MRSIRSVGLLAACFVASLATVSVPKVAGVGPSYVPLPSSARLVDTRPGAITTDGLYAGIGLRPTGSTLDVVVAGRAGMPLDAPVVVLTVTAVDSVDWVGAGFVTVHATGTSRPVASNLNYYAAHNTAGTVFAPVGVDGKVSIYTSLPTQLIVDVSGYLPAGSYTPLPTSARLVDTRPGASTIDGQFLGIGTRLAGSTLEVPVAGRAGIPVDAAVVELTVTATFEWGVGFLTVHPTGTARPNASNVNYYCCHDTANTVVVPVGTDGKVSIYTSERTDLIVDVAGHFPASGYTALANAARLADTRPGASTIDGQQAGAGRIAGGGSLQLDVAGRAGVPVDASAAVLTVAAVDPVGIGFATVHPNGVARPNASDLNWYPAHNMANTVVARIGAGGDVCIFASSATHFVVDVAGYLTGPPPPAAGPTCPQAPPVFAIWPAANVVFSTPEAAAADFIVQVYGVEPHVGPFQAGDSRSGEIEVYHDGDDADPNTLFPSGSVLLLRKLGADDGWFVIAAISDDISITSPTSMDVLAAGPVDIEGLGRGHEGTIHGTAFVAGTAVPALDSDFTMGGLFTPEPYSITLDLAGASSGDVVGLLIQADSGLAVLAGQFAAIPVLIGT